MLPLSPRAHSLLQQVLLQNDSIAYRHMAMESLDECVRENSQDQLIARYRRYAIPVSAAAARRAIEQAGLSPDQIDAVVVNTCTGYLCPGLSSYVAEELGLRKDVRPFDFQGMGCGGAMPGLRRPTTICTPTPDTTSSPSPWKCALRRSSSAKSRACSFPTVSSATGQRRQCSPTAPAAGACASWLFVGPLPRISGSSILHDRRVQTEERAKSPRPQHRAKCGKQVIDHLLEPRGLGYDDIAHWVVHPGGQKVIDAFQRALNLSEEAMAASRAVLSNFGNLSSASVLFVLEETLRNRDVRRGDQVLMCSFGAGFTAFAGLLEYVG